MEALGIGRTDTGRMREQNEDRLYIDNDSGLYIVSDGMGGHAAGEEASRLAVETVVRSIKDDRAKLNRVRQGLEDPNVAIPIAQEAVEVACKTVYDAALAYPGACGNGLHTDPLPDAGPQEGAVSAVAGDLQVKFDTLQSVFLFEDLPLAHLQRLLNTCEVETFDAGETVTRQGERCAKMFVVLEGKLALQQDDRYKLPIDFKTVYRRSSTPANLRSLKRRTSSEAIDLVQVTHLPRSTR